MTTETTDDETTGGMTVSAATKIDATTGMSDGGTGTAAATTDAEMTETGATTTPTVAGDPEVETGAHAKTVSTARADHASLATTKLPKPPPAPPSPAPVKP